MSESIIQRLLELRQTQGCSLDLLMAFQTYRVSMVGFAASVQDPNIYCKRALLGHLRSS